MPNKAAAVLKEQYFISSGLAPNQSQKRLAQFFVFALLVVFLLISGPLSTIQVGPLASFMPAYATAMFMNDSITAILLFAQFFVHRSRAVLVIASGYLFTALVLVPYVLTFPGIFGPGGAVGGLQSAAWLYVVWHTGFPIFVIAYAFSRNMDVDKQLQAGSEWTGIIASIAITVALVVIASLVCILAEPLLPRLMLDPSRFAPSWPYYVGAPITALCIGALIALRVRQRSVLDLWLMVVMCLYLVEVPLSYYPAPTRYSAGWYAVRVLAILSSSLLLIVLLYEITTLYERLLRAIGAQRRDREARLMTGDAIAATIAHEVKQPLSAMITRADTGFRWLDRREPDLEKARIEFSQIAGDGIRAGAVIESIRANFKRDARVMASLDVNGLVEDALALARDDIQLHRIHLSVEASSFQPRICGDKIQLQQVLLNLITNAIDSMASKDDRRSLTVRSEVRPDGEIEISVTDTGTGIAIEDTERVFNPLFTTKSGGMGMGLSICRSIIEAHDGQLSVIPNVPAGSIFRFALRPAQ